MGIRIKLVALLSVALIAQAAVTHAQGTIWEFLGIPQGMQRINDQLVNRRGNRPKLEKKPPLKKIADPLNLESKWEPIKVAAEVKQAEDAAPQKIKAVKYLASIGCACYDKKMDGAVTAAIVAAMDDCTESVRLATIEAISEIACDEKCACDKCGQKSCCSEAILMQLAKLAYERDETGCYVEPSEDVREAAIAALQCCCPGEGDVILEGDAPYIPERERERGDSEFGVPDPPSVTDSDFPPPQVPVGDTFSGTSAFFGPSSIRRTPRAAPPVLSEVEGHVERVDVVRDQIYLTLSDEVTLAVGSDVEVIHRYLLGPRTVAILKVEAAFAGTAIARPQFPGLSRRIAAGDAITGWSDSAPTQALPEPFPTDRQPETSVVARTEESAAPAARESVSVLAKEPTTVGVIETKPRTPVEVVKRPPIRTTQQQVRQLPPIVRQLPPIVRRRVPAKVVPAQTEPAKTAAKDAAPRVARQIPIITRRPIPKRAQTKIGSDFVKAVTASSRSARSEPQKSVEKPAPRRERVSVTNLPRTPIHKAVTKPRSVVARQTPPRIAKPKSNANFVNAVLK